MVVWFREASDRTVSLQSFSMEPCEMQGTGNVSELEIGTSSKYITPFATGCLCVVV